MSDDPEPPSSLPQVTQALASIPQAFVPSAVKALDRLLGAAIDLPVAWLAQKKARIDARTEAFKAVEAAIAHTVASNAGQDAEITQRAMNVLVAKEFRKQVNREAVAIAMVEDLREKMVDAKTTDQAPKPDELDDNWLNAFEGYAEDASGERLQRLWGRVLSGEIRKPGSFSLRALRTLSEFSQTDALSFEKLAQCAFADGAPQSLVRPVGIKNIRHLMDLEASGVIQGASDGGYTRTLILDQRGLVSLSEGELAIVFKGEPNSSISHIMVALTPLGQELLSLVPNRNPRDVARRFAFASRIPETQECYIAIRRCRDLEDDTEIVEFLWSEKDKGEPTTNAASS